MSALIFAAMLLPAIAVGQENAASPASVEAPPAPSGAVPANPRFAHTAADVESSINGLVAAMTLEEKIGQMCQVAPLDKTVTPEMAAAIAAGRVGSIINAPSPEYIEQAQRIAREESRLGIPLLVGRDVIHGYRTVFPIPLGQAASWNPELVEQAARIAAGEAQSAGVNWTFAPMVDVSRDPRWGRIAESFGEDPVLGSELAAAMVRGFQQEKDGRLQGVAACAKHFAAYGLAEGGRDYNRASLSVADLHNVYLPTFHAAVRAGCRTLMTTFSEVNGVPGTANEYLLRRVLRDQWRFDGLVVSDWNSVIEMVDHGFSEDKSDAARQAVNAGVDMEMASSSFQEHLAKLVADGAVPVSRIDEAVRAILRVKMQLPPEDDRPQAGAPLRPRSLESARRLARQSVVLLKNDDNVLPLSADALERIAVIGEMADAPRAQLGCWVPDGDANDAVTPLQAIRDLCGEGIDVQYARGAAANFSMDDRGIDQALQIAQAADVVLLFLGEDSLLSGEARSRATLELPGAQRKLLQVISQTGKPTVLVVMAGRPLAIAAECQSVGAALYAWHPGVMGGPAIADVLFGYVSPSGKLPVTFPRSVGQTPLYYAHPNTGRPAPADYQPQDFADGQDLPALFQYKSHYIDSNPLPLFPFGYGLSYTTFAFDQLELSAKTLTAEQTLGVRVRLTNTGSRGGTEVAQLYIRDLVASVVRPIRELKAFRRVYLRPGESKPLEFAITADELAYYDNAGRRVLEPGRYQVFVGEDSRAELAGEFELTATKPSPPEPVLENRQPSAAQ